MNRAQPYPKERVDCLFIQAVENTHFPDVIELYDAFAKVAGPVLSLGCEAMSSNEMAKFFWEGRQGKDEPMDYSHLEFARFKVLKKMLIAGKDVHKALVEFHKTLEPIMQWRSEFTDQEWKEFQKSKGETSTG